MYRRTSPLLRAARALIGLVTIWCLGCSGYEPLLGALLGPGAGSMMACDTGMTMGTPDTASSMSSAVNGGELGVSALGAVGHGFDCDCGSCHAPSPTHATAAAPESSVPAIAQREPSEPASVSRSPLLPPPEFAV